MRLVVKKWIPQYEVAVLKNKEVCGSIDSCFNTEKALLMSIAKFISVVFRVEPTITTELYERKTFANNKSKI